ncbi:MAG: DUF1287 domain-containing protein [Hyphomicrobiaceae bacterium]
MKKRGKAKPRTQKVPHARQSDSLAVSARTGGGRHAPMPANARFTNARSAPPRAVALTPAYASDERRALALLLLPFLIVAMALGLSQTLKPMGRLIEVARPSKEKIEPATPVGSIALAPISMPASVPAALRAPERIVLTTPLALPNQAPFIPVALIVPKLPIDVALVPPAELAVVVVPPLPVIVPLVPPTQLTALIVPTPPVTLPLTAPNIPAPAAIAVSPETLACLPTPKRVALSSPPEPSEFGGKLAQAAQAQTNDFVIYSAIYKRIAYPMGDVPSLYGACSDLVIRAYRALGVDLQDLVQRARVGRGDPNIDHRRTDTLRAFFTKYGESIAPSIFGEDYKPGDIVTYYRPYSRVSRAHIAIVSDVIAPSGRPMIVHNRGWGPQIEDALFVDRITGHYRFTGAPQLLVPSGRMVGDNQREPKLTPRLPLPKAVTARHVERVGQLR